MMEQKIIEEICYNTIGFPGRMVSASKSSYCERFPDHKVYFNANIICETYGKIWFGDIDCTTDEQELIKIADQIDEDIYVLYEMDARFGAENRPFDELRELAVWSSEGK